MASQPNANDVNDKAGGERESEWERRGGEGGQ